MNAVMRPIAIGDVISFRACLDAVARERKYLALFEALPLEQVHEFVAGNIANHIPQVVAEQDGRVVGWCDVRPNWFPSMKHCGELGMGVLDTYRGQGIGAALLERCIKLAKDAGMTRIELEARSENAPAISLYRKFGFKTEGVKERGMLVDGVYYQKTMMALLL